MPRQALVKSAKVPLPPLNGEEVSFWLHILEEHATFLRAGLLGENPVLSDQAQAFYQQLHALRRRVEQSRKLSEIVDQALPVLVKFYQFQRQILNQMITCELHSHLYPLQVDHLIRENGYAIRLFEKIQVGKRTIVSSKAQENLFWVRIMADHSQFIGVLTDPSERNVVATARSFTREFDDLYLQGRDFVSLLDRRYQNVPVFLRYLEDTRRAVCRLRDFTKTVTELINECRLVGILPAQLADHFRREAEHDLMILAMLEKDMLEPEDLAEEELFMADTEMAIPVEDTVLSKAQAAVKVKETAEGHGHSGKNKWPYQYKKSTKLFLNEEDDDNGREEAIEQPAAGESEVEKEVVNIEVESPPGHEREIEQVKKADQDVAVEVPPVPKKPKASSKVKWSGQWPRPLGKKD